MRSSLAFEIYTDIIVLICKYACTYDEKVDRFAELPPAIRRVCMLL